MSAPKKTRGDATLKNLSADRQHSIIERMKLPAPHGNLTNVRAWLREDGVDTSESSLSRFWEWWHLQQQFQADEQTTNQIVEELKREAPQMTEEQLDDIGQRTFSLLAIRRGDPDTFVKVRSARTRGLIEREKLKLRERAEARLDRKLVLETRRLALSEARDKAKAAVEETAGKKSVKLDPQTKAEILAAIDRKLLGE
jgi:hypothetical protein